MPETDMAVATVVAERLRRRIASEPFPIQEGARSIEVTISIGIAGLGPRDTAASVIKRADQAVYRGKRDGRKRVVPDAAGSPGSSRNRAYPNRHGGADARHNDFFGWPQSLADCGAQATVNLNISC